MEQTKEEKVRKKKRFKKKRKGTNFIAICSEDYLVT